MFAFWSSSSHKLPFYGAENVGFTVAGKVCRHCLKWLCVYAKCVNMCLDMFMVLFSLRILLMSMCLMLQTYVAKLQPPCEPAHLCLLMMLQCSLQTVVNCSTGSVVDTCWACSWALRVCWCLQYVMPCVMSYSGWALWGRRRSRWEDSGLQFLSRV